MSSYRIAWAATGDTIGYIHQVFRVVSGADLTFFFDHSNIVMAELNTALISYVAL
jgi:16S rRNA U1498 N3-methylase RsmE